MQYPNMYPVDLKKGPAIVNLNEMYLGDALANRIGAIVTDGGEAASLSGTCSGTAILSNGGTVALTGTISGNQAYVDLPSAAYVVEGPIEVFVCVTASGTTTTLVAGMGNVRRTQTGTVIDPGTVIPSVSALIEAIEDAVESIPADYSALLASIAPTFSSSTAYAAGTYAWYSGTLYRFTADHAAGSWTGSDAVAVVIGAELATLKSAIQQITVPSTNRLNLSAITANTYINVDGTSTPSENFSVTDYIPVTAGETIYFWDKRTDNQYYLCDARFLCAYNSSRQAVSEEGGSWVPGTYTVPSGIAYVRLSISNTYLSTYSNFYVGSLPLSDSEKYEPYDKVHPSLETQVNTNTSNISTNTSNISTNTTDISKNKEDIQTLFNDINDISERTSNLLDVSSLTDGKYIQPDGSEGTLETVSVTDYIPVSEGQKLYGWGLTGGRYTAFSFIRLCAYNSSKEAVSASGWSSETTPPYTVPSGISYVRITVRNTALAYDNPYIGTHDVGIDYEHYGIKIKQEESEKSYSIGNGDSILEAVLYCYENGIQNLIVEAGTYDIIDEYEDYYGPDYFTNYVDYSQSFFDAGIWLQNISVKFSPGAKVVCKYTGNNSNVPLYFSAFATGNNVVLDGLVIDAENLRYAIHADYNSGANETYFVVRNCDLKHYKNSTSMQAIGAGLGRHVTWTIENTIFRSSGGNHIVCRIHNNVNSDALSKVIIRDCYIDGDGYFKFEPYSTSTAITIVQVCGCSYKTAPVVEKITQESENNMVMIAWNNELRS